ncbi:hypothetical protein HDC92_004303 [Pedobacter sp. AK017]|uniref:hypothetical protein n=1 Tax=Pedobacter sp. AK017 TaxID=2723073 RepID=UPI0016200DE0|nr:hypothetical protein [Pedobacter sp. AK017]MBB5440600.1 hypothetical protein [Pedobacter sp. AK017]
MKTFFHAVEPYHIQASGMRLTVLPMEDGVYRVCHRDKVLADLYPEITAAGIFWNGFGQLSVWVAEEIGQQICAHEI